MGMRVNHKTNMTQDPYQHDDEELRLQAEERRHAVARWNDGITRVINIIYYLTIALEILLLLRIILSLLSANRENQFAQVIYSLSEPFVAPFATLFSNPSIGTSQFDVNALAALLVYALLAWLVARLVWIIGSRSV